MNTLLYITYDFNFKKTASSRFFYDFLSKNFDVDTLSPQNDTIPYDDINSKDYYCIVSFYYMADFSKFNCKNLIFVPMYDDFAFTYKNVKQLRNIKIINFCKYLHRLSILFGLHSFYIQYFTEPEIIDSNNRNLLFYWQRRETSFTALADCFPANIQTIKVKRTILHSATDREGAFIKPDDDIMNRFNITITDWFENKADLINLLDQTMYYIAPRKQEGIGLSFLDAMSRGCVIIAHNDRTMNEYIRNGKNGYLIDFDNPQKIKFKDFEKMQRQSIKTVIEGRNKYIEKLPSLINFIHKKDIKTNLFGMIGAFIYFGLKKVIK